MYMYICTYVPLQISADNGCGFSNWSDTTFVNLTSLFPPRSVSESSDATHLITVRFIIVVVSINWLCPPIAVGYYIATGIIIGCVVFAAVVLTIINRDLLLLCTVYAKKIMRK